MPVSRLTAEGLSEQVTQVYARAEVRLLRAIARQLAAGHTSPKWAEDKMRELQLFRARAQRAIQQATRQAVGQLGDATVTAYVRGAAAAEGDLLDLGRRLDHIAPKHAEHAVEALVRAQAGQLEAMTPAIVRQTADAYRDAVQRAVAGTLTGAATRLEDAQVALDQLARQGISGFTDKAGRRWGLEAYVDMATRTTTAQAAVAGHMDRLEQAGINLFIVSDSPRECPLCRPWEGAVLTRGPYESIQTNVLTGEAEHVQADGTVEEAMSTGLFHPNCTHNLSAYIHGATERDTAGADPEGYEDRQRQRALERKIREWKRREAVALTPEALRLARSKVRGWQQALRDHLAVTGLPRKRYREAMDVKPWRTPGDMPAGAPLGEVDTLLLETELADLMAAGDYGPRFAALSDELDRRDKARATVPGKPNTQAEQEALNRLLFGGKSLDDLAAARAAKRKAKTAKEREKELRAEYEAWVHQQWLRAEEECRGKLLSPQGEREFRAGLWSITDIFTRKIPSMKVCSPELQEWFAQPGNERLSFPEFRAGIMNDKRARDANWRRRNRGWESEYG